MSQPRRRRRRRRRSGGQPSEQAGKQGVRRESAKQDASPQRRARRRRGRRGRSQDSSSPSSSEELVRALPKERPTTLSAPPDGQDLDEIIGELQSVWGVPQYPQEYRITIKVHEEREGRGEQAMVVEETPNDKEQGRAPGDTDVPIREKAPAAPLMRSRGQGDGGARREKAPRRRKRRRGRGSGGGGGGGAAPSSPQS